MPCILKIRVHEARDLPVMDRLRESTDAYVEVRFGSAFAETTRTVKRTLSPVFNDDFRIEVSDDGDVQNHPLELRVMDHDQVTRDGPIGNVHIDLNPLISSEKLTEIAGWFPIFDTLHGMRGDVRVSIKLDYFGDINPFKHSSAGIQFFSASSFPSGFKLLDMLGFVEELLVADDPEYHWADSFRSPRASNEARQREFLSLSGQLRRLLGRKVLEMGGNAVVGFQQNFELEDEGGIIIARAIGTACKIKALTDLLGEMAVAQSLSIVAAPALEVDVPNLRVAETSNPESPPSETPVGSYNKPDIGMAAIGRLISSNRRAGGDGSLRLCTLRGFEPGIILRIAGLVTARSVKLVSSAKEVHDSWRNELREEIRSHARSLGCQDVVGYTEQTTILDDLVVLSAMGTAVELDWSTPLNLRDVDLSEREAFDSSDVSSPASSALSKLAQSHSFKETLEDLSTPKVRRSSSCSACHLPSSASPFLKMSVKKCAICKKAYVPEIVICTAELLPELQVIGTPKYLEVHVCKSKKRKEGEINASSVSDALPFLEYDIHRQLLLKMKVMAVNAVFGFHIQITVADDFIVAVGVGTAVFLGALPVPPILEIETKLSSDLYSRVREICIQNHSELESERAARQNNDDLLFPMYGGRRRATSVSRESDLGEDDDALGEENGPAVTIEEEDDKTNYVIKVEDETDEDLISVLLSTATAEDFSLLPVNTLNVIPLLLKHSEGKRVVLQNREFLTIARISTLKNISHHPNKELASIFGRMQAEMQFNLRNARPCCVSGISYEIISAGENSLQINTTAMALTYKEIEDEDDSTSSNNIANSNSANDDLLFEMDTVGDLPTKHAKQAPPPQPPTVASKVGSPDVLLPLFGNSLHSIECTSLDDIPGATVQSYLGRLNLCFVKEQTTAGSETGGLSSFCHTFLLEVHAIARAHAKAMGGNAVVAYRLEKFVVKENPGKNSAYALCYISGDVVVVVSAAATVTATLTATPTFLSSS